jgi:hypothetical protein
MATVSAEAGVGVRVGVREGVSVGVGVEELAGSVAAVAVGCVSVAVAVGNPAVGDVVGVTGAPPL